MKIQNIQHMQNMNYGVLIYNKIKMWILGFVRCVRKFRMYFGISAVFCTINCYFEYRTRIRCIFLYIGSDFKDIFEHFFKNILEV